MPVVAFQNRELLAQGQILDEEVTTESTKNAQLARARREP